jgi:phosphoserine phosphatase
VVADTSLDVPPWSATQKQVADLLTVLEVSRRLTATPELQPLLELIEQSALRVLDCERASVFLYDPRTDELYSRVATGVGEVRLPAGSGIAGEVFRTGSVVNVSEAYDDPRFHAEIDRQTGFTTRSILACSLLGFDNDSRVGVLQVLNKRNGPFDAWDEVLVRTFSTQAGVAVQRQLYYEEREQRERFEYDLEIAREIQQALLPKHPPLVEGFDIAGWNQPADATGGDFFDFQERPGGNLAVTVADVSGHGIGPALVVAECRAFLIATLQQIDEPLSVVTQVNRVICDNVPDDRFVTMFFGLLQPRASRLEYVSAGHGPVFFYSRAAGRFRELRVQGCPLGVTRRNYAAPGVVAFEPGDFLAIVTDGFFEWTNARREPFGTDRLLDRIHRDRDLPAAAMIQSLYRAVRDFAGDVPQLDDVSAVVIKKPWAVGQ